MFQAGQFLSHGAYPILGHLLVNATIPKEVRNRLVLYMMAASGITYIGFFLGDPNLRKLWLLFLPLVAYSGLYYFIYRLEASKPVPTQQFSSRLP